MTKHGDLSDISKSFTYDLTSVKNLLDLNKLNSKYIGKNGIINKLFKLIDKDLLSEKIEYIKNINLIKSDIINSINLKKIELNDSKTNDHIDITIPGSKVNKGNIHVLNKVIADVCKFFEKNGFLIENEKEIDTPYYNFDALNMSIDHPARNLTDTFYIDDNLLLRTHTSNVQIHVMMTKLPPMRYLSCGKVYRRDYDISHTPMFHQIEGFIIDVNISLANLKYILLSFFNFFFDSKIEMKFRSSFFPFTEPSFEVDIKCVHCLGKGCGVCKNSGWIEILGCGIIHPFVLKNCNINSEIYSGLAFGIGVERLAMIKYKINDIKLFFENNVDFLKQF